MAVNNFDFVAPFYDQFVRLIFGSEIRCATNHFLDTVNSTDSVLILGGGTGELLEAMPRCREIVFLDKSSAMIQKAEGRNCQSPVEFIRSDFIGYMFQKQFEVVICPFFLDCFTTQNLTLILSEIQQLSSTNSKLMITDFQRKESSVLVWWMHLFFSVFACLESKKLKDIHFFIEKSGFINEKSAFFHQKNIFSRLYRSR